ncbi:MAG: MOSC domain-containing protein [Myxococcales bacterium]|nr:MOSC domain-containing protein [Myxococcales bacterium]
MRTLPPPTTTGHVQWIGVRPERGAPMRALNEVEAVATVGLRGDRYHSTRDGKRQVTLIQGEHLPALGAFLGRGPVAPERTRRNLVIEGVNLLALKHHRIAIGEAVVLEYSGLCAPCGKMDRDDRLGPGGFAAMRGHGGITARILVGGVIRVGDPVRALLDDIPTDPPPQLSILDD